MENNKYLHLYVFVAVVFILGITFLVISLINESHQFTIYKNECRNETGYYSGYRCEDGSLLIGGYEDYLEIVTLEGIRCFKNNDTWKQEVCEQREVEEMNLYYSFFSGYNKEINEDCKETYHNIDGLEYSIKYPDFFCGKYEKINKSYLQKHPEWLDENAIKTNKTEYKIGDYIVEVKG